MLSSLSVQAANPGRIDLLDYNEHKNTLSLSTKNADLKRILRSIVIATGLEVLIDPSINQSISINLRNTPLEKSLSRLLKSNNFVFYYSGEGAKDQTLAGIKILLSGQNQNSLVSIMDQSLEYLYRQTQLKDNKQNNLSMAHQRWQKRYDALTDNEKKEILERAKPFMEAEAKKNKFHEALSEKRKIKHQERLKKREENNRQLKEISPKFYARNEQRRREIEMEMLEKYSQEGKQ